MRSFGKKLLGIWKAIARPIGVFNSYLLLTVLFLVVVPLFNIKRIFDPLRMRLRKGGTYWEPRRQVDLSLERFERPF